MLSGEATNTNFIDFGLTRSGIESMIYCTQGEYANYYTTDVVESDVNTAALKLVCQMKKR
jgi:hypothetical protein